MQRQQEQDLNLHAASSGLGELLARLQDVGYDVQISVTAGEPHMTGEPAVRLAQWLHNARNKGR
jgi:hypothetical protein